MILATFSIAETSSMGGEPSTFMSDRRQLLWSFSNRFEAASYPLLVLMCGLLSTRDYTTLCPLLWSDSLANLDPKILAPVRGGTPCVLLRLTYLQACFLAMQCAEKCGNDFINCITSDLSRCLSFVLSWHPG